MPRVLIVAYGNPLRTDDGVAWHAADMLAEKLAGPDIEIIRTHQLCPELAETLRGYERVIFIDAAFNEGIDIEPGSVRLEEAAAETSDQASVTHAFSPRKVLSLAAELYGIRLRAFSVTVQGANFDHGNALSPQVANALPDLIFAVERLVSDATSRA